MPDYDQLAYNLRKPLSVFFPSYAALLDLGRGTAMPTTGHDGAAVQASARFFRTDLGFACYYDGTRWLTAHEYFIPIVVRQAFTVTNSLIEQVIRTDYAPYVTRSTTLTNIAAPLGAANYWTVTIAGINTARTASSTIETFATSGDTAAVETLRDNAPNTSATMTNRTLIRTVVQITAGAPGAITIAHALYVRLIVT